MLQNFICLGEGDETLKNRDRFEENDFHLELGEELGWVRWLKNWLGQDFIINVIIPTLYLFR